ncbi:MAG: hypothetical protein MJE68_33215 [Proteobacteria bacterium]|nr:hypothetical protein [Pseudomonadota bacterium]
MLGEARRGVASVVVGWSFGAWAVASGGILSCQPAELRVVWGDLLVIIESCEGF